MPTGFHIRKQKVSVLVGRRPFVGMINTHADVRCGLAIAGFYTAADTAVTDFARTLPA